MKLITICSVALAAAISAYADNCQAGYQYCGSSLLKKGDYRGQIQQAFIAKGEGWNTDPVDWMFHCIGGPQGLIKADYLCKSGCKDNGWNKDDSCN